MLACTVGGELEALKSAAYPGGEKSVDDHIAEMVGQIGENMSLRRSNGITVEEGVVATYIHGQVTEVGGQNWCYRWSEIRR